jgi:putative ABC transport system ATP-binding protein
MIVNISGLEKSFKQGSDKISVIKNFNLSIEPGQTLAILGPSGSGKSTLLSLLAGLDQPDSGQIEIVGENLTQLSEEQLTLFRAKNLGIVFQQYHLFAHLTALENVMLALEILGYPSPETEAKAALTAVGLQHRTHHFPHQLSGGENQRVAIARAFAIKPKLLLADEPSGSLDSKTGEQVMDLLFSLVKEKQTTLVLVTHNEELAQRCQRQLRMHQL